MRAASVIGQDSANIAPRIRMRVTPLPSTFEDKSVKALWVPATSVFNRLTKAPVRTRVKKASGICWIWSKSFFLKLRTTRANGGGEIGLRQAKRGVQEAENTRQDGETNDERGVALKDAIINDVPVDQGIDDADARAENDGRKKDRQKARIGSSETQHSFRAPRLEPVFYYAGVLHEGKHQFHPMIPAMPMAIPRIAILR